VIARGEPGRISPIFFCLRAKAPIPVGLCVFVWRGLPREQEVPYVVGEALASALEAGFGTVGGAWDVAFVVGEVAEFRGGVE